MNSESVLTDGSNCEQPCFLQLSMSEFKSSPFTAARVGEADARHYRVLLQAAGGGGSSAAAYCPLHRRNVCQGADGGSKTVSNSADAPCMFEFLTESTSGAKHFIFDYLRT